MRREHEARTRGTNTRHNALEYCMYILYITKLYVVKKDKIRCNDNVTIGLISLICLDRY